MNRVGLDEWDKESVEVKFTHAFAEVDDGGCVKLFLVIASFYTIGAHREKGILPVRSAQIGDCGV